MKAAPFVLLAPSHPRQEQPYALPVSKGNSPLLSVRPLAVCVQMVRSQVQCRLHHAPFVAWALFPASKVALYAFHVFLVTIRHRLDQVIRATVYLVLLARLLSVQLLHRAILAVLAYSQGRILANAPHALLVPSHPHLNLLLVGYAALDRIRFRERRCVKNACREHIPQKLGQPI